MEPTQFDSLIGRLQSLLDRTSGRIVVALAGIPGSGKTTLARTIEEQFNLRFGSETMVALGMDGFHLSRKELLEFPNPTEAFARRGAPWTFSPERLRQRISQIRSSYGIEGVSWPGFEHDVGDPVEDARVISPVTRLVLIEGLYLLYDKDGWGEVRDQFDETWFLDVPLNMAMSRLLDRHMRAWQLSREEVALRIQSNDLLNANIVVESKCRADFLINQHPEC